MPHPKNHMKLTGDTHPPEVEYDLDADDDAVAGTEARRLDDVALRLDRAEPAPEPFWTRQPAAASGVREFARARPVAAAGITLIVGYALLKLLRR